MDQVHKNLVILHDSKLEWAVLDPEFTMHLEHLRINNFKRAEVEHEEYVRWNLSSIFIFETLLKGFAW